LKSLVTGAGGFIGSALVRRLLARGEVDVRGLVRTRPAAESRDAIEREFPSARVEFVVGDLRSAPDCRAAVDGVGVVYHVAGATKGSPADMVANTVVGSKNLLDAMVAARVPRVVLVSSFSVYSTFALPAGSLVDESTPLEKRPELRDGYAYAKLRQEELFWEYRRRYGLDVRVVRPGVVYGPSGRALSPRVGLDLFGTFLHLGRGTVLPLSYVDNCAEAIAAAGAQGEWSGQAFNAVDDDLPTSREFLREYRARVRPLRYVTVPYPLLRALSWLVERYHRRSRGQLPAIFTPYKTASLWKGHRYSNDRIKALGWKQIVPTNEGIRRTMEYLGEMERR
jgi:nucleoside-diphosphate-sugar epimerase